MESQEISPIEGDLNVEYSEEGMKAFEIWRKGVAVSIPLDVAERMVDQYSLEEIEAILRSLLPFL